MNRPLKVGFDLDGVLLYNPARIFRPITVYLKKILPAKKHDDTVHFYYPKSYWEQLVWKIVHWSSFQLADGIDDIYKLVESKSIEAVIVTSRYDCLKDDFHAWLKTINKNGHFKATFHNKDNIQPHVFKEKMINKLGLDYFVEDNWDIVHHIRTNTKAKPLWVSNPLDKHIPYELKFFSLKEALSKLKSLAS